MAMRAPQSYEGMSTFTRIPSTSTNRSLSMSGACKHYTLFTSTPTFGNIIHLAARSSQIGSPNHQNLGHRLTSHKCVQPHANATCFTCTCTVESETSVAFVDTSVEAGQATASRHETSLEDHDKLLIRLVNLSNIFTNETGMVRR